MTRDWLILEPGAINTACPHHNGRCAYSASDPKRCPTCHVPYAHIALTKYHSCKPKKDKK